jgi:mannose-6-phosphate isomerase-like protein (cupin superfamily)
MLEVTRHDEAVVHHLDGRDWMLFVGPTNTGARNLSLGLAVFPPGSAPDPHVHVREEEVIWIVSGYGRMVAGEQVVELEPGTGVYIPPGTVHGIETGPAYPLQFVSVFSPPVVPGSYDAVAQDESGDEVPTAR